MKLDVKWAQWVVSILAVVLPLLIVHNYRNQKSLLRHERTIKQSLKDERDRLVAGVLQNELLAVAHQPLLRRTADRGQIDSGRFPDFEVFIDLISAVGKSEQPQKRWLELLRSNGSFFSGLPHRYAGFLELMDSGALSLEEADRKRLYRVAFDLFRGHDLNEPWLAFCLNRLPEVMHTLFIRHRAFAGLVTPPAGRIWARNDQGLLVEFSQTQLDRVNQALGVLDLEVTLVAHQAWQRFDHIVVNVSKVESGKHASAATRRLLLKYGLLLLALELLLMSILFVLRQYDRVHRFQAQLLAAAPHELRTPLAVIRQFAEMLLEKRQGFDDRSRTYLDHIHRESLKMQVLIENMLSVSQFEQRNMHPNPESIALEPWLESLLASLPWRDQAELNVSMVPLDVCWDPIQMGQVLINLLENAHIHAKSRIDLYVAHQHPEDRVVITIRDYGEPVSVSEIRKIEAFKSGGQRSSGLGLGLYLSRRIVVAHGGHLVLSPSDPGLVVTLELPRMIPVHNEEPK